MLLAGFLRLNAVYMSHINKDLWADSHIYFTYAKNLRQHSVYSHYNLIKEGKNSHSDRIFGNAFNDPPPDNFIPPGYPLFLYLFLADLPEHLNDINVKPTLRNVKLAQAIVSTITVLITFFISRLLFGTTLAFVPMLIVAISPRLIISNLYILTETLFCCLLCLTVLLMTLFYNRSHLYNFFVGSLIAFACLTKASFQYFIIFFGFFSCFLKGRKLGVLFLIVGFVATFSPWVIRNYISTDIVPGKNLMASTLLSGGVS